MNQHNFKCVFSLDALHSFFEGDICACLQWQPGEASRTLMKRFGFLLRRKINGLEIYTDHIGTLASFFEYIGKALPSYFDFTLQTDNRNFALFTDLPVQWKGAISYDSREVAEINDGIVTLLPIYNSHAGTQTLANVRICFDDILKYGAPDRSSYFQISFKARVTLWQYFIVNRSDIDFTNPAITGKDDIQFNGPVEANTPGGEHALLFTSGESLLPLSEKAQYHFDFVNNFDRSKPHGFTSEHNILYKGLPVPDPSGTTYTTVGGRQVFSSPMYIYL